MQLEPPFQQNYPQMIGCILDDIECLSTMENSGHNAYQMCVYRTGFRKHFSSILYLINSDYGTDAWRPDHIGELEACIKSAWQRLPHPEETHPDAVLSDIHRELQLLDVYSA